MIVTEKDKGKELSYTVTRQNNHETFLACISADGSYLKPLIVIKRKTLDVRICRIPIMDKIIIGSSESGFINSNLFDRWVENALIPYIKQRREEHKHEGRALLLLDGASSHFTKLFFDQCNANKIKSKGL